MLGQLTNDEIEEVLKSNLLGRIGCSNGRKIYVVPVNYVYDRSTYLLIPRRA